MSNIHIVTVATKPGGYLKWLEESCIINGTKLLVLGMGAEWKGYITKYLLMNDFLKTIPEDDIVCFVDAYDVLMVQHIDKLKEKFLNITEKTNCKIICAIDPGDKEFLSRWSFDVSDGNKLINSGTYIGYSKELKVFYNWTLDKYHNDNSLVDDQLLLNTYYKLFKNNIIIDNQQQFFLCEKTAFHEIKEKDDYVFLHRCANVDMVLTLVSYNYNISINEIIELKIIDLPICIDKLIHHTKNTFFNIKNK